MATGRFTWISMLVPALAASSINCTDVVSPTDLEEEGPPMVRQVFLAETLKNCPDTMPDCTTYQTTTNVLAYGTHPFSVEIGRKHPVLTASPIEGPQKLRVVMDELLIGNYLEEIACNDIVDDDQYAPVPVGANPEDIADCAVPADVLPQTCIGEYAVCIGPNGPVGVLDQMPPGGDGASDDTQFIRGAVGISCTGPNGPIEAPVDLQRSFWQPSGNQQVPSEGGINGLGPAVVLVPTHGMPAGQTCHLVFADNVTDKAGNRVCAPLWGADGAPDETSWPPSVDCPDGDTTAASWGVENLRLKSTVPVDNGMNFPRVVSGQTYAQFTLNFNAEMNPTTFLGASLNPAPAGAVTAMLSSTDVKAVQIRVEGGLAAQTMYTLTITGPTDYFGIPLAAPIVVHFTTGN